MLRVLTWFWSQPGGRTQYTAEHVNIWAAMVRRNLTLDHKIAVVTAQPEGIDDSIEIIAPPGEFEKVQLPHWPIKYPQCLRRLVMFAPNAAEVFGDRFVCMDLDCVIGASLDPLFDHDDDFRMFNGSTAKRPYNGSMMQLKAGTRAKVYTEFTPERGAEAGKHFVGSDQAWISHILGWGERTWGPPEGVFRYRENTMGKEPRLMFFPGFPKPWQVSSGHGKTERWIGQHYHAGLREAA